MEFCTACGGRILPKIDESGKRISACVECGKEMNTESDIKSIQQLDENNKIKIKDEKNDIQSLPIEKEPCSKCGNEEAYSWQRQTRSGDEPATRFYRCVKCEHTWREYS